MKKNSKKLALIMSILVLSSSTVFADVELTAPGAESSRVELTAESALFSVTVPMELSIDVDENGVITTATNAKITNNSHGAVIVNNVSIEGVDSWAITDFETDMTKEKVGSKKIGFEINGVKTNEDGEFEFNQDSFPVLDGKNDLGTDELAIVYDAKLPAQKTAITDANIANVVFTIGWYE